MFEQINQQLQESMKPFSDMATLNMNAMQSLAQQQNTLLTTLLNDGVEFMQKATTQKDLMALAEVQKSYLEETQSKLNGATQEAYQLVSETQQGVGKLLTAFSEQLTEKFTAAAK